MNAPVERINLARGNGRPVHQVMVGDSEPLEVDLVVSNADLHHTYGTLFEREPDAQRMRRRLANATQSVEAVPMSARASREGAESSNVTRLASGAIREGADKANSSGTLKPTGLGRCPAHPSHHICSTILGVSV